MTCDRKNSESFRSMQNCRFTGRPQPAIAGRGLLRPCIGALPARSGQTARPLNITGYVIDAELDTATHHLTATTPGQLHRARQP